MVACLVSGGASSLFAQESEVAELRKRIELLEGEVKLLRAQLLVTQRKSPDIRILPGEWGSGSTDDIGAVCRSTAKELWCYFPDRPAPLISVRNDKSGPMVVYGLGESGEYRVLLNTNNTYWSQYAYQFAHEMCHILCNYRDGNKDNLWFEESLCETASLFALRRMGDSWREAAPYPNWKSYAPSLSHYAQERIDSIKPPPGKTLAAWYREQEAALRKNGTDRDKNLIVAVALLPLLEKNPEHWRALEALNQWPADDKLTFPEYLRRWHAGVDVKHKSFVADVAKLFEITLTP